MNIGEQKNGMSESSVVTTQPTTNMVFPTDKTLQQAAKISLKTKKSICFYFYIDSLKGKVCIANDGEEQEDGKIDRIIFKNEDEHTSPILNTYKSDNCFIVVTENTIYIISAETPVK